MYCRADGVVGRCAAVDVVRSTARGQSRRRRSLCSNAAMSGFRCKLYTRCNLLETSFVKTGTVEMTSRSSLSRWRSSWIFVRGFRRFLIPRIPPLLTHSLQNLSCPPAMKIKSGDFTLCHSDEKWNENLKQTTSWNRIIHTSTYKEWET